MEGAVSGSANIVRRSMDLGQIPLIRSRRRSSIFSARLVKIKSIPRSATTLLRKSPPTTRNRLSSGSRLGKDHSQSTRMRIICKETLTLLANTLITIKDQQKNPSSHIKHQLANKIISNTKQVLQSLLWNIKEQRIENTRSIAWIPM